MKKWIFRILLSSSGFLAATFSYVQADLLNQEESVSQNDSFTFIHAKDLLEKSKWKEASLVLGYLLKNEPNSPQIIAGMSKALTYLGKREEALTILNQSAQKSKGVNRSFLIRRIQILSRFFLTDKTFQLYQDGLNFMMSKKYHNAREKFGQALVDEPDNVEILTRMGQSLVLDGDPKQATQKLRYALMLNSFEPQVSLWLGRALFQMNQWNEAILKLTIALNALHGSELASIWLAEALSAAGQVNAAIHQLDHDVQQWPLHVLSLLSVARLRLQSLHADSRAIWVARKDLQLAVSRLDQYPTLGPLQKSDELNFDLSRNRAEIKEEIQRLQQQVEARLSKLSDYR